MKIVILDCKNHLKNYAFILIDPDTQECALIDTVDTNIITNYLKDHNLILKYILNTHHHNDHIGGNLKLKSLYNNCKIYGHAKDADRISGITHKVIEGDIISLFNNKLTFKVLGFDGHTIGHIGYYEQNKNWLFSGDTLFNLGCGRRFEGSSEQFVKTLEKIKSLPQDTIVYGAHEYTVDNIAFAKHIIPTYYEYYQEFIAYCQEQYHKRDQNQPTVPFTLSSQKKLNPFLLYDHPQIKEALNMENSDHASVFGHIRQLKDSF